MGGDVPQKLREIWINKVKSTIGFKLTDNVFKVLAGEICDLAGAFKLLDAHDDWGFDDATPLGLAEVLEEFSHFPTAYKLLL